MYKYEEMNLRELMSNDTLDPESAEVLYAIAQCYRLGKGTEVDMELYKKSLEGAVDAGSEMAKKELLSMENELSDESAQESVSEKQKNLENLPIDELMIWQKQTTSERAVKSTGGMENVSLLFTRLS